MNGIVVGIKQFAPSVIPVRATPDSVGFDLRSSSELIIPPEEVVQAHTNLSMSIPSGIFGMICSRSGLARDGLVVANAPGIIDPDYRGEIIVLLRNMTDTEITVPANKKIAQILFVPAFYVRFDIENELSDTVRGAGRFGSTG